MSIHQCFTLRKYADFVMLCVVFTFLMLYSYNDSILLCSGMNLRHGGPCLSSDCDGLEGIEKASVLQDGVFAGSDASRSEGTRRLQSDLARSQLSVELDARDSKRADKGNSNDPEARRAQNTLDGDKEPNVILNHTEVQGKTGSLQKDFKGDFAKRLPQVLIIGVKKGGTKALLTFLSSHPDIRSCKKEVHFFDKFYSKGLQWYREKMPRSFQHELTMEKSPRYFVTSQVPKRVHKMSPSTKLLVILRDPTKRAISDFVHMKTRKKRLQIKGSLESNLFCSNSKQRTINSTLQFMQTGLYSVHLKNWFKFFPRKQMHFVDGDKMITNPSNELREAQKFLGLDILVDEKNFVYNATKTFYCVYKTLEDRETRGPNAICLGKSKGRKHPFVSEKTLQAIRNFYRPYNEELYKLTGINFGWK